MTDEDADAPNAKGERDDFERAAKPDAANFEGGELAVASEGRSTCVPEAPSEGLWSEKAESGDVVEISFKPLIWFS